ncbi:MULTISPECIES: ABC transporter substrate-binding protein [Corynebacterium]|uniref:ABC transporter substrate-binding protein n=1 Tax=Corynebacterium accolens TaxID=38284 RepID=A0ABT7FPF9_9CORY|nr:MULTISPECIES: ABC transporter substrate-binding protein [Corynebacterium]MCT1408766.1 ABC transporter substrate-binding protein [Corynebacterium accolens]MDK4247481.1 ABC transporter substrate-binding protein [Corynebacterium accolens]MDK4262591.1 ABC transporter substrate-binding protein [Corynebacterium accolens]MDK4268442.1 ABC transporter substrate-binding protein [Corynebacterium accolens]MDK4323256.1 ABC transporter substrate-binding protein [Corynebacterium accolens]
MERRLGTTRWWGSRPKITAIAAGLSALALVAASCSSEESDSGDQAAPSDPESYNYTGYMVNSQLATTNAGTAFGSTTSAAQLSTRLYPGLFVPGPSGQLIPNADLVETEKLPPAADSDQESVRLTLADDATFSDGAPVTCDDYLLAYTAGTHPVEFASHMPLMNDIADIECAPHSKAFTLTFYKDQGHRWRQMFGPGTVMPAHALAQKTDMSMEDLNAALHAEDMAALQPVAELWRYGFSTAKDDFDPELQVSYGPFTAEKVGDSGEVFLKANEQYRGDKPALDRLVVWPSSADAQELEDKGVLKVADSATAAPGWLSGNAGEDAESAEGKEPDHDSAGEDSAGAGNDQFETTTKVGLQTDTLTLSQAGIFAEPSARKAFAACVDQAALAHKSSEISGVDVPPAYVRTVSVQDPVAQTLGSVAKDHEGTDMAAAGQLNGTTIKVGYVGPDKRYQAMVEALRASCEPAGITIEDAADEQLSQFYLNPNPETGEPTIDAFLGPVDPLTEYSAADSSIKNSVQLKEQEEQLWDSVPSIPVAAQPRVFIVHRDVEGVLPYTGISGIGWNMDRWHVSAQEPVEKA